MWCMDPVSGTASQSSTVIINWSTVNALRTTGVRRSLDIPVGRIGRMQLSPSSWLPWDTCLLLATDSNNRAPDRIVCKKHVAAPEKATHSQCHHQVPNQLLIAGSFLV